jgi:uncharacterized protein (DUF885 family)
VTSPDDAFDRLLDDFVADELAADPTTATALGVPGHDDQLPDLSEQGFAGRAAGEEAWVERLSAEDPAGLSAEQRIDRELVLMTLRGRAIRRDWTDWRRAPDTYTGPALAGIFTAFLHRLRPEPELVADAAARLRAVPELLAAGRANLDPELASPLLVRRALGQARGAVGYLRDDLPAEVADDASRAELAVAGEVAAAACAGYADFLEDFAERASGEWAIGEERYSAILREAEGLGYGARELRDRGSAAYDELAADMRSRAAEISGSEDWRTLLEELNADHPPTPEAMREAYADWTERARVFCVERDLVTLPAGESCAVVPAPAFQRSVIAVAFYVEPPPFSDRRTGHFFVPFPPAGASAEQVQQRLATNSYASIPTIAVHEAYPGHHWHLAWIGATSDRPVRKVLGSSYFTEGWALYAEQLLLDEGFFADPRQALASVDARLFRAARIVVDTSLHLGEMSVEEAVTFMSTKASLSAETARAEVARYCAWPTQASSYLTGALEIRRMRDRYEEEHRGTAKSFHDALAGSGALPLGLAERALLGASG